MRRCSALSGNLPKSTRARITRPKSALALDRNSRRRTRPTTMRYRSSCSQCSDRGRVGSRRVAGFAWCRVFSIPPIIPYGGCSPIRLQGWHFKWRLPGCHARLSLLPTYAPCQPVCVHPSCTSWSNGCPALCRDADSIVHRHEVESPLPLPQGSSLLPELCCLEPSSLNRPHPPHSQAHRDFTAERLIRDVFAVRERRGDPRVVPSFRCTFLPDMPPSPTSGSSDIASSTSRCRHGLRRGLTGSTLPILPQSVSRGRSLSRLHWFTIATACQVARLPGLRSLLLHPNVRTPRRLQDFSPAGHKVDSRSFRKPCLSQALCVPIEILRAAERKALLKGGNARWRIDPEQTLNCLPRFVQPTCKCTTCREQAYGSQMTRLRSHGLLRP